MSFRELIENLKQVEQELPEILRQAATTMAHDAKALAERTIKNEGFGKRYSTKKAIPAHWLYEKTLNRRGFSYLDGLDGELTNWGEFRQAQGLQTNFVDLSYTARMWQGMRPDEVQEENGRFFCKMGHNDNEGRQKMNWNFERYGDFISIALEGKQDMLKDAALEGIQQLFERYV